MVAYQSWTCPDFGMSYSEESSLGLHIPGEINLIKDYNNYKASVSTVLATGYLEILMTVLDIPK